MKELQSSETALISGGIDIVDAAHGGAQVGGVAGIAGGVLVGVVFMESAAPILCATGLVLAYPVIGGLAGFYVGAAVLGAGVAGLATVVNVTSSTASFLYS